MIIRKAYPNWNEPLVSYLDEGINKSLVSWKTPENEFARNESATFKVVQGGLLCE